MSVLSRTKEYLRFCRTIPLIFLGYGLQRAWLGTLFFYDAFPSMATADYHILMASCGITSLICALNAKKITPLCPNRSMQLYSFVLMTVGSALIVFSCQIYPLPVLKILGLVLAGSGAAVLYLMWADFFGRMSPMSVITYFSLAVILGEVLLLFFIGLSPVYIAIFAVALPLPSLLTAKASFGRLQESQRTDAFNVPTSLKSYPWKPVILVSLCFFLVAYGGGQVGPQTIGHTIGGILVAVLMIVAISPRAGLFKVESLNQILLPLLVISYVFFLPRENLPAAVAGFRLEMAYTTVFTLVFVVLSSISYRYGINPVWLNGIQRALRQAVGIAGWCLSLYITSLSNPEISSLVYVGFDILILGTLVVAFFTDKGLSAQWDFQFAELSKERIPAARLEVRISEIAKMYHLSARESEILSLYVAGQSIPDIEANLFIAQGTIKTHLHRIYQKLDVHSRDELIELISDPNRT